MCQNPGHFFFFFLHAGQHKQCITLAAIFPTWCKCLTCWLRSQAYTFHVQEECAQVCIGWLDLNPAYCSASSRFWGETWRWPRHNMTLTHTDRRWQHEYLVRLAIVFAVQFRFPQTACIGTNCSCSAFSVQQCQLKPYSQLVFNISFKTLGVCGERCRAGHSANQHVNAIEGSMNCSHSMCDSIHMTLEKKLMHLSYR